MFSRPAVAQKQTIAESPFASFAKLQNLQKISPEFFANRRRPQAVSTQSKPTGEARGGGAERRRTCGPNPAPL